MQVDTTFGLAYYKLALTRGWLVGTQDSTGQVAIDRALLYSQQLPAHDRAVITAYRFFLLGQNAAARNIYQQLLAKNPRDADAWYGLGDAWFHDVKVRAATATSPNRSAPSDGRWPRRRTTRWPTSTCSTCTTSRAARAPACPAGDARFVRAGPRRRQRHPRAAATTRARLAGLESARAWSTAQPGTGRAHLAMVDALLANQQYPDAMAEVARFRAADPTNPETPFVQARVRFASGDGPQAAAELKSAMSTITAGDFAGAEDAPTVMADVLAGANIFAFYGDLTSAARVIELADEIRTDVLPASMPQADEGRRLEAVDALRPVWIGRRAGDGAAAHLVCHRGGGAQRARRPPRGRPEERA